MAIEKKSALLQSSEEVWMKRRSMATEKINAYMKKLETMKKEFDPLSHFTFKRVLSQISPQFYTKDELTKIGKINQVLFQEKNSSLISSESKVERGEGSGLKRCRPSNEDSMSDGERRVKPKLTIKRKPINKKKEIVSSPPPELPRHVNNMIKLLDGIDIKYVMRKRLYDTDLNYGNQRLSMPISQIKSDFLTETEKAILETRDQDGKPSTIKVIVLDPCSNEFSLSMNKWNMTTTSIYNLVQDWRKVLSKNKFKKDQQIHIWSFRVNSNLYLLLDTYEPEEIKESGEPNNSTVISKTEEEQRSQKDEGY
ncbi:B3 domain-containing protein At2g24670-like [Vicia villosa]|uniref:B3 domain-containing protein At2g24670-like n=1 Tax=Vicia villosa TaxID=3911 RepID=UPI00273B88EE|nr:B3 domain-containing protein At2g24670-like [Vicia villosa]